MDRGALSTRIAGAIALAVLSTSPWAQWTCVSGNPVRIESTLQQWPVSGVVRSILPNAAFWAVDAAGNPLKGVAVDLVLLDAAMGIFGTGSEEAGFTPAGTRATVTTDDECRGLLPPMLLGPTEGEYSIQASLHERPSIGIVLKVKSFAPDQISARSWYDGRSRVVAKGTTVVPAVKVISRDNYPVGGMPVTFTVATPEQGARFSNGLASITVPSDAFGIARAPLVAGPAGGPLQVNVSIAGTDVSLVDFYGVPGETTIALTTSTPQGFLGLLPFVDIAARFPWLPCGSTVAKDELSGSFRVFVDGLEYPAPTSPVVSCGPGTWQIGSSYLFYDLLYGNHEVAVEFSGNAKLAPARSAPITISHQPQVRAPLAEGTTLKLWVGDPLFDVGVFWYCSLDARTGTTGTPGWPAQPPPDATLIAMFSIESLGCEFHYSQFLGSQPPPNLRSTVARRVLAGRDPPLPEGTIAYAYGPTPGDASPHWYELATSTAADNAHFLIEDGGAGDESLTIDGRVRTIIALAVPAHSAIPGRYQDLWWAGPEESGWGLSLSQHREVLFGELFIYDSQGTARWLAMPSGAWNDSRTSYTGALYRPRGSPYTAAYDATKFSIGPAVGTLTLTPSSPHAMRLDYVIDGIRGGKQLVRIPFGPAYATPQLPFDDLWWGGAAQNGWGVVVAQQYRSFFTLWYTYDEQGEATWFVAPSSRFGPFKDTNMDGTRYSYSADLFRPSGSPWIGANYDPALHSLEKVGSVSLYFYSDSASFSTQVGNAFRTTRISRVPF